MSIPPFRKGKEQFNRHELDVLLLLEYMSNELWNNYIFMYLTGLYHHRSEIVFYLCCTYKFLSTCADKKIITRSSSSMFVPFVITNCNRPWPSCMASLCLYLYILSDSIIKINSDINELQLLIHNTDTMST